MSPAKPDGAQAQVAILGEVNAHLRNTETKQLAIFTAQLAFFGVVLSLLSRDEGGLFEPTTSGLVLYGFAAVAGGMLLLLQSRYLRGKRAYVETSRRIVAGWPISDELLPYWLKQERDENLWRSADRLLLFLATVAELGFTALTIVLLALEADSGCALVAAIAPLTVLGLLLVLLAWENELSGERPE
jgi:hypothetical protein